MQSPNGITTSKRLDGQWVKRRRNSVASVASVACLLALLSSGRVTAQRSLIVPTAAISNITAFGATANSSIAYVATSAGLYRSVSPTFSSWAEQNTLHDLRAISPNPSQPDSIAYADGNALYRSTDGGRGAAMVDGCLQAAGFARATVAPSVIYAGGSSCRHTASIVKSTNDGRTWRNVYAITGTTTSYLSALAGDDRAANHVIAGVVRGQTPLALETQDGGQIWHEVEQAPVQDAMVSAMAIDPADGRDMWIAWQQRRGAGVLYHTTDSGRHWYHITAGLPRHRSFSSIQYDPLSTRVYVTALAEDSDAVGIYASMAESSFEPFEAQSTNHGPLIAITRSGYLFSGGPQTALRVESLIGPGRWGVSLNFTGYDPAAYGLYLLGHPISPTVPRLTGAPFQYFDKGCMSGYPAAISPPMPPVACDSIVGQLIATQSSLPVGGTTSTITYKTLYHLTDPSRRITPPAGSHGGTVHVQGGTFIPYSAHLASVPGYVVPDYFWRYITRRDEAPRGWLNNIGLPLTSAVTATVTKGSLGQRTISVQAFQFAVLTYDPRNAASFRVERANVGVDYATAFPRAVR